MAIIYPSFSQQQRSLPGYCCCKHVTASWYSSSGFSLEALSEIKEWRRSHLKHINTVEGKINAFYLQIIWNLPCSAVVLIKFCPSTVCSCSLDVRHLQAESFCAAQDGSTSICGVYFKYVFIIWNANRSSAAGPPAQVPHLLNISHTHHSASLLSPSLPPGGLSAGKPNCQLPGAAVRPPPAAPPVGSHLPGPHLAELWPGTLVRSSRQRPREALHPPVWSNPRGERSPQSVPYMWSRTRCSGSFSKCCTYFSIKKMHWKSQSSHADLLLHSCNLYTHCRNQTTTF